MTDNFPMVNNNAAGFRLQAAVLDSQTPLPRDWLLPNGVMRLMPARAIDDWPVTSRRLWCHANARYGLPTAELIDWLRAFVGDRPALEIGSGAGDFAHHLGIPGTDSKVQQHPDVAAFYRAMRQPTIDYPQWIETIDAVAAVRRTAPKVVFGSWITHWIDPAKAPPEGGGSVFGVREDAILATGATYVMLGNLAVHQHKPILRHPHQTISLPFLRSRAQQPVLDRIFIWNGLSG